MNAYYTQSCDQITPIYGVSSMEEASAFVSPDQGRLIETSDEVYMNTATGSVDFESNWLAEGVDLDALTLVVYSAGQECWVAA